MTNPLSSVTSWLYHLGDVSTAEAAKIGASNAGLVVIDYANSSGDGSQEYTAAQLDVMRGGKDKLIVSYLSIGEAEDYRPYWKAAWDSNPPSFLSASNPEWPDNYKVKYWDPAWQKIMFDYVDKIISNGFNGLYLDIIDGYQYWEEVAPNSGIDYQAEMAKFVAAIDEHATAKLAAMGDKRDFVIIGQNGEELVDNPLYLSHIDGLAKEDLRFYYPNGSESSFKPVPNGWYSGSQPYLEKAEAAGVQVFVVEYMTSARQTQYSTMLQSEIDYLKSKGIPLYVSQDRDLTSVYTQPAANTPLDTTTSGGSGSSGSSSGTDSGTGTGTGTGTDTGSGTTSGTGTAGANLLIGSTLADKINGLAGADTIEGLGGADSVDGGAGADVINGGAGNDSLRGGDGDDRVQGDDGDDLLYGDAGNDQLSGGTGNDKMYGGLGADTLIGGAGNDLYDGGAGIDTAVFDGSAAITVNLGLTGAQATGEGQDSFVSIENLRTGSGADYLTGNSASNQLDGGAGADTLVGLAGDDTLIGGAGNDRLNGGAGTDRLDGGAGLDTAVFSGTGAVTVNLGLTTAQNTGQGYDTLISIENIVSGSGNDRLTGNALANLLDGGQGADTLVGGGGNDTLIGGAGNDLLNGGDGSDTAVYSGSAAITVNLGVTKAQITGQGTDTLISIERLISGSGNDRLTGNLLANLLDGGAGNDKLIGLAGNDTLIGGAGADTLDGGPGSDLLTGGTGADSFVVRTGDGAATITDFESGIDHILLSIGAKTFDDLTITQSGANTVVQVDDLSITLNSFEHTHLTMSDFTFV